MDHFYLMSQYSTVSPERLSWPSKWPWKSVPRVAAALVVFAFPSWIEPTLIPAINTRCYRNCSRGFFQVWLAHYHCVVSAEVEVSCRWRLEWCLHWQTVDSTTTWTVIAHTDNRQSLSRPQFVKTNAVALAFRLQFCRWPSLLQSVPMQRQSHDTPVYARHMHIGHAGPNLSKAIAQRRHSFLVVKSAQKGAF